MRTKIIFQKSIDRKPLSHKLDPTGPAIQTLQQPPIPTLKKLQESHIALNDKPNPFTHNWQTSHIQISMQW